MIIQNQQFERRYRLQAKGYDFSKMVERVAKFFEMRPEQILNPSKQQDRVRARSLVCYWAVRELGMSGTVVAKLLGIIQSSGSRAVRRGERLGHTNKWNLEG